MKKEALIIVDIQNDYFPGGAFELVEAEAAGRKAAEVLSVFRDKNLPVIHIRHESIKPKASFFIPNTAGAEIHSMVVPVEGEEVIVKNYPNSFQETGLLNLLKSRGVERVVIVGMMTFMCIDATARAARDFGFDVVVLQDACAERDLDFKGTLVPADMVHAAFMAALSFSYAEIDDTDLFIEKMIK